MLEILKDHPWLLIILGSLLVPIVAILVGGWSTWVWAQSRRQAFRVLETYAAQGKEPPPEVLRAITGSRWGGREDWRDDWRGHRAAAEAGAAVGGETDDAAARMAESATSREWRREMRRSARAWRRGEPMRSWRMTIQLGALAAGFYIGSLFANLPGTQKGFLLTAIILGALAAASFLSALMATFFRDR